MKKQRLLLLLAAICLLVAMIPMVASAETVDGWYDNGDGTLSYYVEGQKVTNAVIEIEGEYYGFDWDGIMFNDQEFMVNETWYRAKAGGALYADEWYENEYDQYYYQADAKAAQDFVSFGDVEYYFHGDGMLATDCAVYSSIKEANYALSEDGSASVLLNEGWTSAFGSWYYVSEGMHVYDEVRKIGNVYYGFSWDGKMYDGQTFWCNGYSYYAKADGALITNSWYFDKEYEIWYYFDAEAKGAQDFVYIGGVWYFFWGDGIMAQDTVVYSPNYDRYYIISEDGAAYVEVKEGWNYAFGSWYYAYTDGEDLICAENELREIGGQLYWFDWDGKMAENEFFYCYELERVAVATSTGALLKNGWEKINGYWYYANEYSLYEYGVYEIDGAYYYFEDGHMYDKPGEYMGYYVSTSGALYRNAWRYDNTGYEGDFGWVYYGDDGYRVYGFQTIGGVNYCFDPYMCTNEVLEHEDGLYVFDANGVGTKITTGWFKHPVDGSWMYAVNGYRADGIITLADGTYAFESGRMVENNYYYGVVGEMHAAYLFGADGKQITTAGWQKVDGAWYYVAEDTGALVEGWLKLGSVRYYLCPNMAHNTVLFDYENNSYCAADNDGYTTALSGSGWRQLRWGSVYLEDGKPVTYAWRYLGGYWYYFAESGEALTSGAYYVDGTLYLFDQEGKLATGGWYNISGSWYYSDASGVPVTGMQTIDGVQYLFSDSGWLYYEGICYYEDQQYWIGDDGRVLAQVREGWNQVNGKWYYVQEGRLLRNCLFEDNGVRYGFGSDGAMCAGGICYAWYDYYMFDAGGRLLTGWQYLNGGWHYADPESDDPYIYWNGVYWIDDQKYYFENGSMKTGSFFADGCYITTNASGAITEITELKDGWNYTGNGYYYIQGETPFTGWVGDYYVSYNQMLFEQTIEYNGKYYYLDGAGRYIRGGWYQTVDGAYVYARADGTLYSNEWLYLGGRYYYFRDAYMVSNCTCWIDDADHVFDENGVWLGELDTNDSDYPSMADGWQYIGGKWYYYHANARQLGIYCINGTWYALVDEDGAMMTNAFIDGYYYGADGTRASYVGWKYIDGYWIYFNEDSSVHYGWVKSGNGWYYTRWEYDEDAERSYVAMIANEAIVENGRLYHFGASGYCSGAVEGDGWYQVGSDWYYLEDGYVVRETARKIGGVWYYFNYDGTMMTNDAAYVELGGRYGIKYFGASGAAVDTAGWIQYTLEDYNGRTWTVWLYVGEDGFLYENGIYTIGGVQYTFRNGLMVS